MDVDEAVRGQTIPSRFVETVTILGDQVALRWKQADGDWGEWTFADYGERVARFAAGLAGLGLQAGERVVLMTRNRPEFHVADLAVLMCGATPISIYNSSAPDQIRYLAGHSGASMAIVEDAGFLDRFVQERAALPALRELVLVEDGDGTGTADVVAFGQLLEADPLDLGQAAGRARPDQPATVIYTSGTTGPPKGVVLNHHNIAWTMESLRRAFRRDDLTRLRTVSYLPMAHIADRISSHYGSAFFGFEVTTCPDTARVADYCREVHPQLLFGVPRVWEKIHAAVQAALAADPEKAEKLGEAVAAAGPVVTARTMGLELTEQQHNIWNFLDAVAFQTVRGLMGMDQMEYAISGAAPLPPEIMEWFRAIGVPLSEIYGLSENSGPLTWEPHRVKPGWVGRPLEGTEVRLGGDGEILARGGNVFVGYLHDPERTAEALDADGWLHTGDIGELDDEGYLRIVDRKKELIITAGGKNVSPANIEGALRSTRLIGQAAVIGDRRPFVCALVVLDPEVTPKWAEQQGIDASTPAELAVHPAVVAEVEREIEAVNERFSQPEKVKRFRILTAEWLPDSEELTPTMKLKRRGINTKYSAEIEAIYSG